MKTIKATLIMLVPILVLLCLSGCGPPNCVTVDAGRPFVAQEGMRYGVAEGGITYNFNQNAYPNAQVIYENSVLKYVFEAAQAAGLA